MTDMREALDRLKMTICQLGGIDMKTGESYTFADIAAAEAAVMAIHETGMQRWGAVAEKLVGALKANQPFCGTCSLDRPSPEACLGEYCGTVDRRGRVNGLTDAALAAYNKALEGK